VIVVIVTSAFVVIVAAKGNIEDGAKLYRGMDVGCPHPLSFLSTMATCTIHGHKT
jgi:hypothetical protein